MDVRETCGGEKVRFHGLETLSRAVASLLYECDRRPVAPAGQARRRSGDDVDRVTPITGRQPPAPGTDERIQLEVWRGVVGNMPSILFVE
jgi:hypothetical protein